MYNFFIILMVLQFQYLNSVVSPVFLGYSVIFFFNQVWALKVLEICITIIISFLFIIIY